MESICGNKTHISINPLILAVFATLFKMYLEHIVNMVTLNRVFKVDKSQIPGIVGRLGKTGLKVPSPGNPNGYDWKNADGPAARLIIRDSFGNAGQVEFRDSENRLSRPYAAAEDTVLVSVSYTPTIGNRVEEAIGYMMS